MLKKLSRFLFSSVLAQVFSGVAGLLLARWMPVADYAVFTVMSVLLGAMVVLTQGGVQLGVIALIGRSWPDRARGAEVLHAGLAERRLISVVVLPFLLVGGGWLLMRNHASPTCAVLLLGVLLLTWDFDMRSSVVDQVLLFANEATALQTLNTALNGVRLVCILLLFGFGGLNLYTAAATGVLVAGLRVPAILQRVRRQVPLQGTRAVDGDRREIRAVVRRQLPLEVFYVLQAQIVLAILALHAAGFGTAALGALGKVDQFLLPTQALFAAFAVPRFALARGRLFGVWAGLTALGALPGLGLVLLAWLFPSVLLFFVGPHYAALHHEVLASAVSAGATTMIYNAWQLLANRGWNRWAWVQVPVVLGWCLAAPALFDLAHLDGVLWFRAGLPLGLGVAVGVEVYAAWRGGRLGDAAPPGVSR
jgi:hypothetical protein